MRDRFAEFTLLMTKIRRAIRRIKTEEMAEFNLKSTHVSCLYGLYGKTPLTATELCELCDEDKAAISRSLEELKREGYVICPSETEKRYRAPLYLSEKGEETARRISEKIDGILLEASGELAEGDREIMYSSLGLISDNLDKILKKYE